MISISSKLSLCKAKLEPTILTSCQPIGTSIAEQTRQFVEHVHLLNSFIPPISTKENAHKWYKQGYDIVDMIVNTRRKLMQELKRVVKNETDVLENESKITRERVLQTYVYNNEQTQMVFERDIQPLFEARKQFLQETIIDLAEVTEINWNPLV